ncbi:MAG: DUF4124 domain-containing protein [Nitrospinaceae bacterium]|nr:DUF4124 domain-containing protein [Nitrospinaceae bacterium]NIU45891.1 DUF4124 domain-containing protein [Nitrospinaceae bacterium]NIU98051.1 DUF4124 domain-containing protein [Nitrospinaceae bacterium]
MILALLAGVIGTADWGYARIYKYRDDQGKLHFTNDPSSIPLKYRRKKERFKGVPETASSFAKDPDKPDDPKAGGQKEEKEQVGLSAEDEGLINKSISVLQSGVSMAEQFKEAQPNFTNGRRLIAAIQGALPQKESLAGELAGTEEPSLKEVLGFLNKSIAIDKKTQSLGVGLKTRIVAIFNRVQNEAKTQAGLINKLNQAKKDSEKKKAEAAKKEKEQQTKAGKK